MRKNERSRDFLMKSDIQPVQLLITQLTILKLTKDNLSRPAFGTEFFKWAVMFEVRKFAEGNNWRYWNQANLSNKKYQKKPKQSKSNRKYFRMISK